MADKIEKIEKIDKAGEVKPKRASKGKRKSVRRLKEEARKTSGLTRA